MKYFIYIWVVLSIISCGGGINPDLDLDKNPLIPNKAVPSEVVPSEKKKNEEKVEEKKIPKIPLPRR